MLAANNAANFAGGQTLGRRWVELANPAPEETRTGEEIIQDIRAKLRADFGGGEPS